MPKIDDTYLPIPRSELPSQINKGVHIEGHKISAVYRLINYSETQATVFCQFTRMTLHSIPIDRLRYTRKNQPK